jgi:hypothetical protein
MIDRRWIALGLVLSIVLAVLALFMVVIARAGPLAQAPAPEGDVSGQGTLGTEFTYQGQLQSGGQPVNGACDMAFRLYDQATGGIQVDSAITTSVPITDGLFTVGLDFGGTAFAGDARWLGIRVKCPGDASYTNLGRQELTAAPYALYAGSTGALHGMPITATGPTVNQVLKWDGSAWEPAADADTTFAAGQGLALNGNEFSVVSDTIQQRVADACAVGSTIRAIGADGTVVCQSDAPLNRATPPTANVTTAHHSGNDIGWYSSVTIGADGLGLISYLDWNAKDLGVAHCSDIACTSVITATLDSAGQVGHDNSIAIGVDGLGLISYADDGNGNLLVAHCDDVVCSSATTTTLASAGNVGFYSSLAIGADGLGLISYRADADLRVAHCDDINCTSAITSTLDSAGDVGWDTSLAIGFDGLGLISYRDTSGNLKVAHCNNVACTSATITALGNAGSADDTSLTIGPDGLGLIAYADDGNNRLEVAHCNNVACTSATFTTLDSSSSVGRFSAVTIGADGLPLISYHDDSSDDLVVAHCANSFCVPYFRWR